MSLEKFHTGDTLKIDFASNMQDVQAIIEYLSSHPEITDLNLGECNDLTDGAVQALADSPYLKQLQTLNLSDCYKLTDGAVKALADSPYLKQLQNLDLGECNDLTDGAVKALTDSSNLPQLQNLNLSFCDKLTDGGAQALADSPYLKQLQTLNLSGCRNLTDGAVQALADSPYLKQLQILNLGHCNNLTDGAAQALANSSNLKQLQTLNLSFCRKFTDDAVKALADSPNLPQLQNLDLSGCRKLTVKLLAAIKDKHANLVLKSVYNNLFKELARVEAIKENKNFNLEAEVKKMVFNRAQSDNTGHEIQYILSNSKKYPFLINSVDENGNRLDHFYTHNPNMQRFLFKHGMIPKAEDQDRAMLNILRNNQSVHDSTINKKTNFITNELVQSVNIANSELEKKAEEYKDEILPRLFEGHKGQGGLNPIEIKLLDLISSDKRSVMEKTLSLDEVTPDDISFVKAVKEKAIAILKSNYLRKDPSSGKYDQGHPTVPMQYDWTEGSEKKITIPQSIGLIIDLIEKGNISRNNKQELCVTLLQQNPELVQGKLEEIRKMFNDSNLTSEELTNTTKTHELLNKLSDDQIGKLFLDASGLNIEDTWKQQQAFKLTKQIYVASTTYGDNSSACIQGTWSQIITSAEEIDPELLTNFVDHIEAIEREEAQKNNITASNIEPLVDKVLSQILQEYISNNPELKPSFEDIAIGVVNIELPNEITLEQQEVLGKINQGFSEHIKEYLPNYTSTMPTLPEYKIFIGLMPNSPETQKFVEPIEQQIPEEVKNTFRDNIRLLGNTQEL